MNHKKSPAPFLPAFPRILLCLMIIAGATSASAQTPPALPWQSKVDPWVLETSSTGPTEFLLFLSEQADLSRASLLSTKLEKGEYVFRQLTETARRTQAPLLAALQDLASPADSSLEYRPFWVVNAIWVRGDAEILQELAQRPDVAHIYANPQVHLDLPELSDEPLAADETQEIEWNVLKVNAPTAWAAGFSGQNVVVGGQDTGYDWDHPALINQYRGWNGSSADHNYHWHDAIHSGGGRCGPDSPFPCDDSYHGTHTMGTMVGDDGTRQYGVAPGARWIGCRNMDRETGTPATYTECYQWFIAPTNLLGQNPRPDLAPDVINNSWACTVPEGCVDPNILKTVVENVRAAGILTVHSAGNSGYSCESVTTPAAIYDASFTVGATSSTDDITSFSSRGPVTVDGSNRLKPDITAPGDNIRSVIPYPEYVEYHRTLDGTSMAAPHVAGVAALLISADPWLAGNVDRIESILTHSAVPRTTTQICGGIPGNQIPNNTYGWGRVDAWQAIQSIPRELEISKTPALPFYLPGGIITYTLQVTYSYPLLPTYNLVISDVLPANTSLITATLPHTLTGDTITWDFATFGPHQNSQVQLVVRPSDTYTGTIYNEFYSVSSDDLSAVHGPPVPVHFATDLLYLPVINR